MRKEAVNFGFPAWHEARLSAQPGDRLSRCAARSIKRRYRLRPAAPHASTTIPIFTAFDSNPMKRHGNFLAKTLAAGLVFAAAVHAQAGMAADAGAGMERLARKTGAGIRHGAEKTREGIEKGARHAGHGIARAAAATEKGVRKGVQKTGEGITRLGGKLRAMPRSGAHDT